MQRGRDRGPVKGGPAEGQSRSSDIGNGLNAKTRPHACSVADCNLSQKSGVVPNCADSLCASSDVITRRPEMSPWMALIVTFMSNARSATLKPMGTMNSSRRISPGCERVRAMFAESHALH